MKDIQAEKERLIKEGKIKKQKELPPIKLEEVPYEVPQGWVWTRLGEIGETQTDTTPATKDSDNFGDFIPFVGPGDIQNKFNYDLHKICQDIRQKQGHDNRRVIPPVPRHVKKDFIKARIKPKQ